MGDEFGKRLNIEARKLIKANKVKIKYFLNAYSVGQTIIL